MESAFAEAQPEITPGRMGGGGLRIFDAIAREGELTLHEQLAILRVPETTFRRWRRAALAGRDVAVGRQARVEGCDGLRFMSARRSGGECAAVLRPKGLRSARQAQPLIYPWDGHTIQPERICVKTLL